MLHAVCWCEPLRPLPSIELTIFCSVFRLHPPSFLFVLALDSPPGASIPLPTASLFSCPPPWPLRLRLPFLQGRGVACLQVSMSSGNDPATRVPPLRPRACVQGLPRQGGFFPLFPPPKYSPPCEGGGTAGGPCTHPVPAVLCLCLTLALGPCGPAEPSQRCFSRPPNPEFLHSAAHPLCLASPGPSAEACPTACPAQPLADILFPVQALCRQEPRRCRNMLFSAPPVSPVRASPVLPSPGVGCRACRGLSAAPVTAALCLAGPRGRRWRS